MDVERVRASSTTLSIDLFDVDTGEVISVFASDPQYDLFELFRATAALPALYNRIVRLGDGRFVDGGTRGGVPIERLLEEDCSMIIIILTRDPSFRPDADTVRHIDWWGGRWRAACRKPSRER